MLKYTMLMLMCVVSDKTLQTFACNGDSINTN